MQFIVFGTTRSVLHKSLVNILHLEAAQGAKYLSTESGLKLQAPSEVGIIAIGSIGEALGKQYVDRNFQGIS